MSRIEKTVFALLVCGVLVVCGVNVGRYIYATVRDKEPVPYALPIVNSIVIGDGETAIYHLPDGADAGSIREEYAITFSNPKQAQFSGFHPCAECFAEAEEPND